MVVRGLLVLGMLRRMFAIPWAAQEHGPLPKLLLALTFATGLVDALSYLLLGQVFVANMTGNVVFLGFAIAGGGGFSILTLIVAIVAFLFGALAGGKLATTVGAHRGRNLALATYVQAALVGAALIVSIAMPEPTDMRLLVGLLAIAMGMQNATARRLGVPDLTTTVLTLTLTGLAADSRLAGGHAARPVRRILAAATMFAGAVVGAIVALQAGSGAVLALLFALQLSTAIAAQSAWSSSAAWTVAR